MNETNSEKVRIFMETFGQLLPESSTIPHDSIIKLRILLIEEELGEFYKALEQKDIVGIADGLTDLLYVIYGTGHAFGIDLDKTFTEVHSSNMSKLGTDGKPLRDNNGKVAKGPNYIPPDIKSILSEHK